MPDQQENAPFHSHFKINKMQEVDKINEGPDMQENPPSYYRVKQRVSNVGRGERRAQICMKT